MAMQILVVIGAILTCVIGVWRWIKRIRSEKRKMIDEAQKKYLEAVRDGDTSTATAMLDRINRLR